MPGVIPDNPVRAHGCQAHLRRLAFFVNFGGESP
jgi:hypothetical protein